MEGEFPEDIYETYNDVLMDAAQKSGVSPYVLAASILIEQGNNGTGGSIKGTIKGFEGIYNFFNIRAYASNGYDAVTYGLMYASSSGSLGRPWNTRAKSILGGAEYYANGYVKRGQDNLYYKKFNVIVPTFYAHQYMTNVQAGETESQTLRNAYDETTIQSTITFKIPVFDNMPAVPCSKTGSGSTTPPPVIPEPKPEPEPIPDPTVANGKYYYFTDGRISAVNIGASVTEFIGKVGVTNGSVGVFTAAGSAKSSGTMKTGDVVKIYRTDGSEYASYTVVQWGDVTGDGAISLADLLKVKRQVVGAAELDGWYRVAGDINGDGSVGLADLLRLKQHIVGKKTITQTR
jgi:hypothetical protein